MEMEWGKGVRFLDKWIIGQGLTRLVGVPFFFLLWARDEKGSKRLTRVGVDEKCSMR